MRGTKVPNETYGIKIDKNGIAVLSEKVNI